jgi:hypothetical protein
MTTVTISGHLTTTWVANQGDTNYILAQGSSVTVNTGAPALDAGGYAANRSFQIHGTLDGGCGTGAVLGDDDSHLGGGNFAIGASGTVRGDFFGIFSGGDNQTIENAGKVQSKGAAILAVGADTSIENSGEIDADAGGVGLLGSDSMFHNSGSVYAGLDGIAVGLFAENTRFINDGYVEAGSIGIQIAGDHSVAINHVGV